MLARRDDVIDLLIAEKGAKPIPGMERPDLGRLAKCGVGNLHRRQVALVTELASLRRYEREAGR